MKDIPETCMRTYLISALFCFCSLQDKYNIHTMAGFFLCALAVKQAEVTGQKATFLLFLKLVEASLIFRQIYMYGICTIFYICHVLGMLTFQINYW